MNKNLLRVILFSLIVTGIAVAISYRDQLHLQSLESITENAGFVGNLLFILIYALATVLFLPGSVLTLAGGALFGPFWGTLYNLTGATIGAILAFVIARYLASDWIESRTAGNLKRIKNGVEAEGWRFVAFARLVPLFPFNLLNYALGLTRIRLSHYAAATFVCMIPGAFAYTWLGYAGREAIAGGEDLVQKVLLAIALLAAIAFLPGLISKLRQKPMLSVEQLKQRLDSNEDVLLLDVRTKTEFTGEQGHIRGATNIPLEELKQRLSEIATYEEKPVMLICRTDRRSTRAANWLRQKGFSNLQVVQGGMTDWLAQGLASRTT